MPFPSANTLCLLDSQLLHVSFHLCGTFDSLPKCLFWIPLDFPSPYHFVWKYTTAFPCTEYNVWFCCEAIGCRPSITNLYPYFQPKYHSSPSYLLLPSPYSSPSGILSVIHSGIPLSSKYPCNEQGKEQNSRSGEQDNPYTISSK